MRYAVVTRVVVIDDEALVRSGFELIIGAAPDLEVVATGDGCHALEIVAAAQPDVVLLDIRMPGKNGLEILAELLSWPDPPTVAMMTAFDSDEHICAALELGAAGFLVKDTDPVELPRHIRALAAGGTVLSPQVSKIVIKGYLGASANSDATAKISKLTDREKSVLIRLAHGDSNADVGTQLHLSVGTVKDHVSAIFAKFGVTTRVQAALVAERGGLTGPDDRTG